MGAVGTASTNTQNMEGTNMITNIKEYKNDDWVSSVSAYKGKKSARKLVIADADNTKVYVIYSPKTNDFEVTYATDKTPFGRYDAKQNEIPLHSKSREDAINLATEWVNSYYRYNWKELQKKHGEI